MKTMTKCLAVWLLAANVWAIDLSWYTIGAGGGLESSGGGMTLSGTIAEVDAGVLTGGTMELRGGFWGGIVPASCPGDVNGDGATDLSDLALVLADFGCSGGCSADLTGDGATNLSDLAEVLGAFGCS